MRRGLRWMGLLVLFAFVFPVVGADEKKDAEKPGVKKEDPKKKDGDKKDGDKKDGDAKDPKKGDKGDKPEPKPEKEKYFPIGQPVVGTLMKVDNGLRIFVNTKQRIINGKQVQWQDKQLDFEIGEDMLVRIETPGLAFDDKGRIKKYTKEELDEMKGADKKLWGYTADADALKPQQVIKLFLGKRKSTPKGEPPVIYMIHIAGNGGTPGGG